MRLRSNQLCGRSLRKTVRGQVCAQRQLEEAEDRASSLGKSANRVFQSRCSQEESARAEIAGRFRFAALGVLPRGRAKIADRAGLRRPRTARWIQPAALRAR